MRLRLRDPQEKMASEKPLLFKGYKRGGYYLMELTEYYSIVFNQYNKDSVKAMNVQLTD